jgi:hypothetical protein
MIMLASLLLTMYLPAELSNRVVMAVQRVQNADPAICYNA